MEGFTDLKFNFDGNIYTFKQYIETPNKEVGVTNIDDALTEKWLLSKICETVAEAKTVLSYSGNSPICMSNTTLLSRRILVLMTNFEVAKTTKPVLELSYVGETASYYFQIETPYIPLFNFNLLNAFVYVDLDTKTFRVELDMECHTVISDKVLDKLGKLLYKSHRVANLSGIDVNLTNHQATINIVLKVKPNLTINLKYVIDYINNIANIGVFSLVEPYLIYCGSIIPRINKIYYTTKDPVFKLTTSSNTDDPWALNNGYGSFHL